MKACNKLLCDKDIVWFYPDIYKLKRKITCSSCYTHVCGRLTKISLAIVALVVEVVDQEQTL